ncbi:MAG: translocation/assembly module TamB domain-containing protein [Gammaproteobacteria bacterium]|jgi:translocation and assembly module TamB
MIKRIIFYTTFIILIAIVFLTSTTAGIRSSIFIANLFLPGKLNVQTIHGSMVQNIYLTNLNYQWDNNKIFIHKTQLRLQPLQILLGKIYLKNLQADQIVIQYNNKAIARIDSIQAKAKLKKSLIDIQQLIFAGRPYSGNLSGSVHLTKNYQTNLQGKLVAKISGQQPIETKINITGNLTEQMLMQIDVNHDHNAQIIASFNNFLNQGPIKINGHWNNLTIPISTTNTIESKSGMLTVRGTLNNYTIYANTDINDDYIPKGYYNIYGTGNSNAISLTTININTLGGKINGNLNLSWKPNFTLQANLQATHINPAIKWPRWNGDINGSLTLYKEKSDDKNIFNLIINNLHGSWRKQPLDGYFKLTKTNSNIAINNSYLSAGNNSIRLNGNLNHDWHGNLIINAPNLKQAMPHSSGSLLADLQITNSRNAPQIKGNITANNLSVFKLHAKKLIANANLNMAPNGISNISLSGQDFNYHLLRCKDLDLNLNGHTGQHTLLAKVNTQAGTYSLKLTGKFIQKQWQAQLQQLYIHDTNLGNWHLNKTVPITIGQNELIVNPFCLQTSYGRGKICGKINAKKADHLTGYLKINFPYLSAFSNLIPSQINDVRGTFTADTKLTGTLAQPLFSGNAKIVNASAKIKPLGITLNAINITTNINQNGEIKLKGSATSGHGKIHLDGTSVLWQNFSPSQLKIYGDNILIANNKDYNITASPQFNISYHYPAVTITGELVIPHALIKVEDFTNITTLPDNTIIIKRQDEIKKSKYKYDVKIKIALGNDIKIDTSSLDAQLAGQLELNYASMQPAVASGELNIINGTYTAYSQKLKIDKGSLIFTGGLINNPRLDIRASKTINTYAKPVRTTQIKPGQTFSAISDLQRLTVGVQVSGTLQRPKIQLFSDPGGLSDTDILSYLILGTSANQATSSQTQTLFKTAQLIGSGGSNAISQMQQIFGLTDFGVSQEELPSSTDKKTLTAQPAFGVGKYITPKLYLHYSIGISNPVSVLNLTYYISRLFSIQTQSSSFEQGADIFYTFESN